MEWKRNVEMRMQNVVYLASIVALITLGGCSERQQGSPGAASPYSMQIVADKPVGYWRLNETSGTKIFDQTANGNHGAIGRGVTVGQGGAPTGNGDAAMLFDGTSGQIQIPNAPSLEMAAGAVTIEAWIKPQGLQEGTIFILAKGTAGVQTEYALALANGVPAYQSVAELYVAKTSPLEVGVWTHVAVTVSNNSAITFFVNGKEAGTFSAATNHVVSRSTQPVVMANEAGLETRFFGALDEVALYPSALTAEQVARRVAFVTRDK